MKTGILAQTHNVVEASRAVERLLTRNRAERKGLALIYGLTGLGKTAFVERTCFSSGWLYYRMKKEDTAKSFLIALYQRLNRRYYNDESVPRLSAAGLEAAVIDLLADHPDTVIVIDEINLITQFKRWGLAELIRDLIDSSFATVIMVGEETTYGHLERYNKHYFDRAGFFYEFTPNTVADYKAFLAAASEITFADGIAVWLHKKTKGNLRQAVKTLEEVEAIARAKGLKAITSADQIAG